MDRFLNRGRGPIIPGYGEIVVFPGGATAAARPSPPDWPRARGGCPRPMRLGLGKRWDESHLPIVLYIFNKASRKWLTHTLYERRRWLGVSTIFCVSMFYLNQIK